MVARAGLCALFATAISITAAADPAAPDVSMVSLGVSGVAGLEDKPGVAAGFEASAGYRFRRRTSWHARAWWAPYAARRFIGGDSGGPADYDVLEFRTGPTWWACTSSRCLGISTEAGLQRLRSDDMYAVPDHKLDYAAVIDGRFRCRLGPTRPVSVEFGFGFRFKARIAGDDHGSRTGGGLLFSLGLTANL